MTDSLHITSLLTAKDALNRTRLESRDEPALQAGEILLRIDRVAITTNNITYAAFGEAMQYWGFFPTGQPQWGHMPVWGFAQVVVSGVPGIEVGERFYGYFPIASHLRMRPVRVTPRGFYDDAPHRRGLTSAYNQYTRCSEDAAYRPALENHQMLLRPLFITSFMLADFLQDQGLFGAHRLLFSSASSKTAYGTAFCLQDDAVGVHRLALTSARNRGFVERLGCYVDGCFTYDALASVPRDAPTVYVDFSGDEALRAAVHEHLGSALVYDCYVGSTQNTQFLREQALPGPAPVFFFAPVQIRKRNADWGHAEVSRRFNEAQLRFIRTVSDAARPWMAVEEHRGFAAAQQLIADLHDGRIDPAKGHAVVLTPDAA